MEIGAANRVHGVIVSFNIAEYSRLSELENKALNQYLFLENEKYIQNFKQRVHLMKRIISRNQILLM